MNNINMVKIGNWWFLDEDPNRKEYADIEWGDAGINQSMADVINNWFQSRTKKHALDIGANVGFMTAYFAKHWQKVTAFEPTPSIFSCLEKNCTRNNINNMPMALSNETGTVLFAIQSRSEINQIVSSVDVLSKHWSAIEVPAATLDSLNLTDIDMIKIDVEGHELNVLKGAEQTIRNQRPLIAIEISFENKVLDKELSKGHADALDLLKSWGYKEVWHNKYDYIMEPV
jgi:FkbM family methyltransferase